MESELALKIFLIIGFLAVAVTSSLLLKKIHFPYTIGLVIIGFIVGIIAIKINYTTLTNLNLTPESILYLILPTLIFDASINMDIKALKKNIVPILLIAILGLLVSAGIIGGILSSFTPLGIGAALLFGALISATDPVAVIALFSEIGAPRRLGTLIDGESIFNDATAIVLFTIVLSVINSGANTPGSLFLNSLISFLIVLLGGLFIGAIVGFLGGLVVRSQKNNLILQITFSLIMAYISFITADLLDVSGVMSTLAAGIVFSLLSKDVIKHENHNYMRNFWDFFSFVANSFVFLLLGLTEAHSFSEPNIVYESLFILLIVIPTVTAARALVIYLIIPIYNRFSNKKNKISLSYQTILFWGGLRGAVPVALVLAIPQGYTGRDIIDHITLGYILFTLLVQGTTIKWIMNKLNIKADKSYFDYHKGISYTLDFPTVKLLDIVTSRVLSTFKDEGFYVEGNDMEAGSSYLLSRGQKYIALENDDRMLKIIAADQNDLTYGKQSVYETLLELDTSVSTLQNLVQSPQMNEIVKEEVSDLKLSFNIKKYLNKNLINVSLKGEDKLSIITELIDMAISEGVITDRELVLTAILEREKSMSTGLDNGIAIPHAKCNASDNIILVVGLKKEGIDFDSLDSKPSKLFFLIISPKAQVGPHIQLMAEIGRKMINENIREQIISATSADEIIKIFKM
ncbi:MAG: cation:proton antiporter [Spirochaetaceae bacterium]|jgi:Na+/H+ antiporter|nr:cation:proton antiporter [Spirochaetaceae bacterium]